jgi:hypothetical protein
MRVFYRRRGVAEQQERSGLIRGILGDEATDVDYFSQWVVLNFSGSKTAGSNFTFA